MEQKTNQELMAMREKHVPQGPFNVTPLFVEKAKGAVVYDVEGRKMIDFSGGIGVMNVDTHGFTPVALQRHFA